MLGGVELRPAKEIGPKPQKKHTKNNVEAPLHGPGPEDLGIGTAVGLGHRVTAADLVFDQRLQELRLLRRGAVVSQDLGIALYR